MNLQDGAKPLPNLATKEKLVTNILINAKNAQQDSREQTRAIIVVHSSEELYVKVSKAHEILMQGYKIVTHI
jgi:hypothetical protein